MSEQRPTPSSVARAHKIADAWAADAITRGTRFISSVSLLVLEQEIALALDAQRERDMGLICNGCREGWKVIEWQPHKGEIYHLRDANSIPFLCNAHAIRKGKD